MSKNIEREIEREREREVFNFERMHAQTRSDSTTVYAIKFTVH